MTQNKELIVYVCKVFRAVDVHEEPKNYQFQNYAIGWESTGGSRGTSGVDMPDVRSIPTQIMNILAYEEENGSVSKITVKPEDRREFLRPLLSGDIVYIREPASADEIKELRGYLEAIKPETAFFNFAVRYLISGKT